MTDQPSPWGKVGREPVGDGRPGQRSRVAAMPTGADPSTTVAGVQPGSRRLAERRNRVFRAAVELFVEQGYDNTTMDEIAERSDVARASVFNYFQRKSAFLEEWSERRRGQATAALRSITDDHDEIAVLVRHYMRELAQINYDARSETQALLAASIQATDVLAHPPLRLVLLPYLETARERGQVRGDADLGQAATLLATGYVGNMAAWIDADPETYDLAAALDAMVDIVFGGLQSGRP